jgi:preprotein translocase subunit SecE
LITTLKQQAKDLFLELNRVDWPGKDKVLSSTYAVVIVSLFFAGFFAVVDWLISKGMTFILPHH